LTEVLMSLAIMGIGVVMVATIFPLSTLRVLEASKQTGSTITRFSAEPLIDVDPAFVHNPDGTFPPGGADRTPYNSFVFRGQNYWVDPFGWQTYHRDAGQPVLPEDFNNNGTLDAGEDLNSSGTLDMSPLRDFVGSFVPGSGVTASRIPRRYTGATMFVSAGVNPYPANANDSLLAIQRALQLVSQPDHWNVITEGLAVSATPVPGITTVTLDQEADLSPVNVVPGTTYRAVIFDIDGTRSEIRQLTSNPTGQTLAWSTPLPTWFETSPSGASSNIGRVRVEQMGVVYTWALSVRKRSTGPANVDVVVYFKRSFQPEHEAVYDAVLERLTSDGQPNNTVTVDFTAWAAVSNKDPAFRRGGWLYDTLNGLWYRIQAVQNQTDTTADLVLDRNIQRDNTVKDNQGVVIYQGGVIINPSIVNVFPLEIKEP
jgi:hypothetical protein